MKTNGADLLHQLNKLVSENAQLRATLAAQQYIAGLKENEFQALQLNYANNVEAASALKNQGIELEMLQDCLNSLEQQRNGATNRALGYWEELNSCVNEHHQLQDLQQQYLNLQIQFADLKCQLDIVNARNLMLQNQKNSIELSDAGKYVGFNEYATKLNV